MTSGWERLGLIAQCTELDIAHKRERHTSIYFLIDDGEIVYVGQTIDVDMRIADHIRDAEKTFDRAFALGVATDEAPAYEGAFIRSFNPRYCLACPADDSRDAEILAKFGLEPDPIARADFEKKRAACWPVEQLNRVRHNRRRSA